MTDDLKKHAATSPRGMVMWYPAIHWQDVSFPPYLSLFAPHMRDGIVDMFQMPVEVRESFC